jgi:hypothetical protein
MVDITLDKMCDWERKNAVFLLGVAEKLGMDTGEYGELAVNPNSGYTYLWLEAYNFTLYMPIDCDLRKEDIYAMWTSPEDGEEREMKLTRGTTLEQLERWAEAQVYRM